MKITIFGTGYVGLVTGACMSDVGHEVICMDIDEKKINKLKNGEMPIYEPGLDNLVKKNYVENRLDFTTDAKKGVDFADLIFIAVGTPSSEDGSADLSHVLNVAQVIAQQMNESKVLVIKSTVPIGTNSKVHQIVKNILKERNLNKISFDICSNPEFLKEGCAVDDFNKADRIIIGSDNLETRKIMAECYSPFTRKQQKIIVMSPKSAEMTKYAANAMLATKISFMNEMSNIAERTGVDIEEVRHGIGSDRRIGYEFIYPGCGYGGSCFPKDVRALIKTAIENELDPSLIKSVEQVNQKQKETLFNKVQLVVDNEVEGKTIALWGLSFKPETDDMREAPSMTLMEKIWQNGGKIRAYDPVAMDECRRIYGEKEDLFFAASSLEALQGSDLLVICSEWKEFLKQDLRVIRESLTSPIIIDGRNIFDPELMMQEGINYYGVGRGLSAYR